MVTVAIIVLWPKAWQLACTVDHLANPGDFYEYTVGQYSVLIVRDDNGALRRDLIRPGAEDLRAPGDKSAQPAPALQSTW